jgi:hypothetical protein
VGSVEFEGEVRQRRDVGERVCRVPCRRRQSAFPAPLVNVRKRANRREVVRRNAYDLLELVLRLVKLSGVKKRAPEGHTGGQIAGMLLQARTADADRLVVLSGAAISFRELCEGDRRRVVIDPASQFLDAWIVGHSAIVAS